MDSLVEERVAQLQEILARRNALLREMFHLLERRDNIDSILSTESIDNVQVDDFLDRFDLFKHPDTGSILALPEDALAVPSPRFPEEDLPPISEELEAAPPPDRVSPMSDPPLSDPPLSSPNPDQKPLASSDSNERESSLSAESLSAALDVPMEVVEDLAEEVLQPEDVLDLGKEVPELGAEVPELADEVPELADEVPELTDEIQALADEIPQPMNELPHPMDEVSQPMDEVSELADDEELVHPESLSVHEEEMVVDDVNTQSVHSPPKEASVHSPVPEDILDVVELPGSNEVLPEVVPEPLPATGLSPLPSDTAPPEATPIHEQLPLDVESPRAPSSSPATPLDFEPTLDIPSGELPPVHDESDHFMDVTAEPVPLSVPKEGTPAVPPRRVPMEITAMPPEAFMLPPRPSSQVTISASLTPIREAPAFNFVTEPSAEPPPAPAYSPYQMEFQPDRQYTIPPLKSLPPEFQRKGKPNKIQRKREKERAEKGTDARKDVKEDWLPIGINKWGVVMRANPLWRRMSRATKTLSTREWSVAFAELRYIRALERVEVLKDSGKWSYRQPKKQRGVGGLTKTHWDYLLDEMKWMRIDYREERKWKIALAYDLSTAVLEWHAAGTRQVRKERGIIVCWSKPHPREIQSDGMDGSADLEAMDIDYPQTDPDANLPVESGSDDSDDEQEQDKQDVVDALETTALLEEALDTSDQAADSEQSRTRAETEVRPKEEDVEDPSVLASGDPSAPMDVDAPSGSKAEDVQMDTTLVAAESSASGTGLKPTSDDPVLGTVPAPGDQPLPVPKPRSKSNVYAPLRSQIAYSDEHTLFLDFDELHLMQKIRDAAVSDPQGAHVEGPTPPVDISAIFPELQPYNFFEVSPVVASKPPADGRKKSEKRDRDDPHKRQELTTYSKLTPVASFMLKRPTLLGPLKPSEHWKQGHWTSFDDRPVVADFDAPIRANEDTLCSLFEGGKPSLYNPIDDDSSLPSAPRDPLKRMPDGFWTNQDDLLLKRLVEKYPKNWGLISDTFNSTRGAISTERRTDWECKERFKARWIGKDRADKDFGQEAVTPTSARPVSQMTTRKRMASISTAAPSGTPAPTISSESRKRRRHALLFDTIRKVVKKREATAKANANPRKPSAVHDTHGQFSKLPKLSPAELSRMKADKETREQQEAIARRRAEETARQIALREQAQRGQAAQAQAAQQPAANGAVARPPSNGLQPPQHHQAVPQIRSQVNISQQQRLPSGSGAPRISPQQLLVAQQRALAATNGASLQAASTNMAANHLSPPSSFAQRAATSSPVVQQSSPPRTSATPNPPRPPSAQQQQMVGYTQTSPNMHAAAAVARPNGNIGHYYPIPNMHQQQFTQEQMVEAMRIQSLMQRNVQMTAQGGAYPPQA
ncbi:hypothetical protein BV25DRAFT_1821819 [Artomyces pyxidatus]|uniref:Uncharacterized protein n=1 Tax=Artomyces pyxidatus TaxID=48021 RepID=A0ACB8TA02_9AGAM|nr:hypothetical protein BV25DRAFT_1821819 [Artomyces pyxidatus]